SRSRRRVAEREPSRAFIAQRWFRELSCSATIDGQVADAIRLAFHRKSVAPDEHRAAATRRIRGGAAGQRSQRDQARAREEPGSAHGSRPELRHAAGLVLRARLLPARATELCARAHLAEEFRPAGEMGLLPIARAPSWPALADLPHVAGS